MNMIWEMVLAYVHAAETLFVDPKTGPERKQWVINQIMQVVETVSSISIINRIVRGLLGGLVDAAVIVMKKQVDEYHKTHPEDASK